MTKDSMQIALKGSIVSGLFAIIAAPAAWATPTAQNVTNLTIIGVSVSNYNGEVIDINVSETVVAGCTAATAYVVRDSLIINEALALVTSALVAGRSIDVYLDGTCDASGNPNVEAVKMH